MTFATSATSAIGIHFAGVEPGRTVIPLGAALGVGPVGGTNHVDQRRWDELNAVAPTMWRSVDHDDCDLVIYAHSYQPNDATRRTAELAQAAGKPCVFFRSRDDITPAHPSHGVVYRDSIIASRMTSAERAMPALTNDLLREQGNTLHPRPRGAKPDVGFCGYTSSALHRLLYRLQGRRQKAFGLTMRTRALNTLERDARLAPRFIRRSQFWGGAVGPAAKGASAAEQQRAVREEYIGNIVGSLYTLCMRGAGNFSYRLYEVLCLGRIPLFLNTDCALPFPDAIDWKVHCVWVEQNELAHLGDRLLEFHESRSDADLAELQRENRRLWEEWLRPLAFYRHVIDRALT